MNDAPLRRRKERHCSIVDAAFRRVLLAVDQFRIAFFLHFKGAACGIGERKVLSKIYCSHTHQEDSNRFYQTCFIEDILNVMLSCYVVPIRRETILT